MRPLRAVLVAVSAAMSLAVAAGCGRRGEADDVASGAAGKVVARRPDTVGIRLPPGIVFDPSALRPGVRVGDLVVERAEVSRTSFDSSYVGSVRFRGEVTLAGRTIRHFDSDVNAVCFEANPAGAATLPRWPEDQRRPWFCFSNLEEASRLLAPPGVEREATIVIDEFTTVRAFTDAVNEARLVRVHRESR